MKLAVGPLQQCWSRAKIFDFYQQLVHSPAHRVYLGETVCAYRQVLSQSDWQQVAHSLQAAGKEVVWSSPILVDDAHAQQQRQQLLALSETALIEANELGMVQCLQQAKRPFIAGPYLNIYNGPCLDWYQKLGAQCWCSPVELSHEALAALLNEATAEIETEVFVHGQLPLAISTRCFTARHHHIPKQNCEQVCANYPDGLALRTQADEAFLSLNGVQVLSASIQCLMGQILELAALNITFIRLAPQAEHMNEVLALYDAVLQQDLTPSEGMSHLQPLLSAAPCNGYWFDAPGHAFIHASSA